MVTPCPLWPELVEPSSNLPFTLAAKDVVPPLRELNATILKKEERGEQHFLPHIILFALCEACCCCTIHVGFILQQPKSRTENAPAETLRPACQCAGAVPLAPCCSIENRGLLLMASPEGIEAPGISAKLAGLRPPLHLALPTFLITPTVFVSSPPTLHPLFMFSQERLPFLTLMSFRLVLKK